MEEIIIAQSDYTVGVRTKYSKVGVTLADFVHQFCDHKDDCTNAKCPLRPVSEMVIKDRGQDIAYTKKRHCEKFRDGATGKDVVRGANIREVGVWK